MSQPQTSTAPTPQDMVAAIFEFTVTHLDELQLLEELGLIAFLRTTLKYEGDDPHKAADERRLRIEATDEDLLAMHERVTLLAAAAQ